MRRFIVLAALASLFHMACSVFPADSDAGLDSSGYDFGADHSADDPGPDEGLDAGRDAADDVQLPDPSIYCAPDLVSDLGVGLLPKPRRTLIWGVGTIDEAQPATSFVAGLDGVDESEMARLDAAAGLTRVPTGDGAGLTVNVHAASEWDGVKTACASDLPENDESYILRWSAAADGKHVVHIFAPTATGRLWAWKTVRQILTGTPIAFSDLFIADFPASKYRGVIETFYGAPYKEADRLALFPYLADMKYNQYIYAGKMDAYTNWIGSYWPDEWPVEYTDMMERMTAAIRAEGMVPGVQLRIDSLSLIMSSSVDMENFLIKIRLFYDLGFRLFSLSFDDTQKIMGPEDSAVYATFDEGTIDFSRRAFEAIHQEMPDMMLGWVPADYFTNATDASVSLPIAGMQIPAYVSIGWTGTEVMPPTITADDADAVAEWLKRKPLLGDNYPVLEHSGARVFLGPLAGRANDLADHLDGILFNPMPFPFASLPGLASCADYAWNSVGYNPDSSVRNMVRYFGGQSDGGAAAALELMAVTNNSPTLAGNMAPGLVAAIDFLWAQFEGTGPIETSELRDSWFMPFTLIPDFWVEGAIPSEDLRKALSKWAEQYGRYGHAGLLALDMLEALNADETPDSAKVAEFQALVEECRNNEKRPTGDIMQNFLDKVEAALIP